MGYDAIMILSFQDKVATMMVSMARMKLKKIRQ
jgi:hypothetical protein